MATRCLAIAFSLDGKLLGSSNSSNKNLILWNLDPRHPVRQPIILLDGSAMTVAFSPDGRTLTTVGPISNYVVLWDLETRQPIGQPLSGHRSNVVSWPLVQMVKRWLLAVREARTASSVCGMSILVTHSARL